MDMDPDTYPTPEDEYAAALDFIDGQDDDDVQDDAEEWRPGTCDNCPGHTGGQAEMYSAMASAIVPVCACAIGQGAPAGQCQCGPELGREHTLYERPGAEAEEQSQPATDATATLPDYYDEYALRKTNELMDTLFHGALDETPAGVDIRQQVAKFVVSIIGDMAVHLTVPH